MDPGEVTLGQQFWREPQRGRQFDAFGSLLACLHRGVGLRPGYGEVLAHDPIGRQRRRAAPVEETQLAADFYLPAGAQVVIAHLAEAGAGQGAARRFGRGAVLHVTREVVGELVDQPRAPGEDVPATLEARRIVRADAAMVGAVQLDMVVTQGRDQRQPLAQLLAVLDEGSARFDLVAAALLARLGHAGDILEMPWIESTGRHVVMYGRDRAWVVGLLVDAVIETEHPVAAASEQLTLMQQLHPVAVEFLVVALPVAAGTVAGRVVGAIAVH